MSCSRPPGGSSSSPPSNVGGSAGRGARRCRPICIRRCSRRSRRAAWSGSTRTRPPRSRPRAPRPHDRHHRHGQRQVARVQPAGARHARRTTRAPARSTSTPPRRSPRTRRASCPSSGRASCATRSTTATRRARSARAIRDRSNLILTNPDMLHVGVLPHHKSWGDVLANLAWVVVDEAHVYRGVFGSHVANVLRRLRRLAQRVRHRAALRAHERDDRQPGRARRGAHRPRLHARATATAPRAPTREIAMWNPPLVDEDKGIRGLGPVRGGRAAGRADGAGGADDLLPEVAPRRGADPEVRHAAPGGRGPRRPGRADRALPRGLHARRSGGRSSARWPRASCWRWWPPTRWSSASTWATSTRPSA